jgi:hypothetical protein
MRAFAAEIGDHGGLAVRCWRRHNRCRIAHPRPQAIGGNDEFGADFGTASKRSSPNPDVHDNDSKVLAGNRVTPAA